MPLHSFDDEANVPARAVQIWQILIGAAALRQTVTYGQLARTLHFGGAGVFGQMLYAIHLYCEANGLPMLNSLVVNKDTGLPGDEYPGGSANVPRTQAQVWAFEWYLYYTPTDDDFRTVWEARPQ